MGCGAASSPGALEEKGQGQEEMLLPFRQLRFWGGAWARPANFPKSHPQKLTQSGDLCPKVPLASSPALSWRDVQHLVVRASKPAHLQAEDWAVNGVGRKGELVAQALPAPHAARPGLAPFPRRAAHEPSSLGWPPLRSEPPLRLRAAGRRAAGGAGQGVDRDSAPEEVLGQSSSRPPVRNRIPWV